MSDGPSQGMNLGGAPSAYADNFYSLDLLKGMQPWNYFVGDEYIFFPQSSLNTDEKGWIKSMPVIDGVEQAIFSNVAYTQLLKPGKYILEWEGEGTIGVYQDSVQVGPHKLEITYEANYTDAQGQPQDDGFSLIISATDPNNTGDYIRNIKLYAAADADLIAAGEVFDPVWQNRIDDFRVLRTHGWQNTNFPTAKDWNRNVVAADQAGWGDEGYGMPFELLVKIANETRSDLWITIPHTATDDYIREVAKYVKANLDGDLRLHVEYSNEYWTTGFDQNLYFTNGGAAAFGNADFAAGQFYGTRAAHMADIFAAEFGPQSKQLMPVLTVDNVFFLTGEAEAMLNAPASVAVGGTAPVGHGFDVIATDGYLFWYAPDPNVGALLDDWMTDADGGFGRARDYLLAQLKNELLPSWQAGRALADQYGLDFMVYEGGALLLNGDSANQGPQRYTDFAIAFSKSTEMKQVYKAELAAWKTVGSGPFAWYADVERPGFYGDYGHWKGPDFVPDPRADAIVDANGNVLPWWAGDGRPGSTFDNGIYRAGTAADNRMQGSDLADRLYGLAGADTLDGRAGNDKLWSGDGRDAVYGGAGNDDINGGPGADRIYGGVGRDMVDYRDSLAGVTVNLAQGTATGGTATGDVLVGIESLRGTELADRLTGDTLANRLMGAGGADALRGGNGADTLLGGAGSDTLTGGPGNDAFVYRNTGDGGDRIADFASNSPGNNDGFRFLASAFGDHAVGALKAAELQVSGSAVAANASIRIIYNRDDGRLYFDADGSGTGASILIATLQAGTEVAVNDFLFY